MKSSFLTLLCAVLLLGGFVSTTQAQQKQARPLDKDEQAISVRLAKQKKASRSKLTVKFVELVEDSRCPEGTQCVWAGNAKIKIQVKSANEPAETFELNTNTGATGATYGRYVINFINLTPTPKANVRLKQSSYTATFAIRVINR